MRGSIMKFQQYIAPASRRSLRLAALFAAAGLILSGCVVYPSSYGYGGYAPAYYAPPVIVGGGWGWGGGWRGGRGGWR